MVNADTKPLIFAAGTVQLEITISCSSTEKQLPLLAVTFIILVPAVDQLVESELLVLLPVPPSSSQLYVAPDTNAVEKV